MVADGGSSCGVCGCCVDVHEQQQQPLTPKLMMTMNCDDHDGDHDDDHEKMMKMTHGDHGELSHRWYGASGNAHGARDDQSPVTFSIDDDYHLNYGKELCFYIWPCSLSQSVNC